MMLMSTDPFDSMNVNDSSCSSIRGSVGNARLCQLAISSYHRQRYEAITQSAFNMLRVPSTAGIIVHEQDVKHEGVVVHVGSIEVGLRVAPMTDSNTPACSTTERILAVTPTSRCGLEIEKQRDVRSKKRVLLDCDVLLFPRIGSLIVGTCDNLFVISSFI